MQRRKAEVLPGGAPSLTAKTEGTYILDQRRNKDRDPITGEGHARGQRRRTWNSMCNGLKCEGFCTGAGEGEEGQMMGLAGLEMLSYIGLIP